ncbi:alpha/beta hydrolase [uncultured Corynebacterium sp.]|uniref:alpha/beta hydrolase n=1 Tax=uncultured Corynebacterium sp. TaxID=159447 RepID=UPI0025F27694|nr:alpha/beta hydrolase [uncultured Corynebacterium sp.]
MTNNDSPASAPDWRPGLLGEEFPETVLELGPDPDGETDVVATVIRFTPPGRDPEEFAARPAVLWIHGLSDYFFHEHVARSLDEAGYAFYAVDLRKCGRSRREGQRWHHITDLSLYDVDLDAATALIRSAGHPSLTPLAHSTGGLIAALWLNDLRDRDPETHAFIAAAVLNSPWLDLQYSRGQNAVVRLATRVMSRRAPDRLTPDKGLSGYGRSISSSADGEWDFDLTLKPITGHVKSWSWLAAVLRGHRRVRKGLEVGVPCLVLHSDRSAVNQSWSPALDTADAVLNVEQIAARTRCLGRGARSKAIPGARHDVFLSKDHARALATSETILFLDSVTAG